MSDDALRARIREQFGDGIPERVYRPESVERASRMLRGLPLDRLTPEEEAENDERLEKQIVAEADKRMRALGFVVWNLSQPRASKLTAGIPDRLYTAPSRQLAVFWEAKSPTGKQRPDQRVFQEHADATGLHYVLGTDAVLFRWLSARGIALTHAPT